MNKLFTPLFALTLAVGFAPLAHASCAVVGGENPPSNPVRGAPFCETGTLKFHHVNQNSGCTVYILTETGDLYATIVPGNQFSADPELNVNVAAAASQSNVVSLLTNSNQTKVTCDGKNSFYGISAMRGAAY